MSSRPERSGEPGSIQRSWKEVPDDSAARLRDDMQLEPEGPLDQRRAFVGRRAAGVDGEIESRAGGDAAELPTREPEVAVAAGALAFLEHRQRGDEADGV